MLKHIHRIFGKSKYRYMYTHINPYFDVYIQIPCGISMVALGGGAWQVAKNRVKKLSMSPILHRSLVSPGDSSSCSM